MFRLSKRTIKRLENFPVLKAVVDDFIIDNGCSKISGRLTNLTVYIRMLDIDVTSVFNWNNYVTEEFLSWGHNSRYANVLEPMLYYNLNIHICRLLNYLEAYEVKEPDLEEIRK